MSIHIILLLDESGSMLTLENKPLLATQNILNVKDNNTLVSLYKFNKDVTCVFHRQTEILPFDYKPCFQTALFDAIGSSINMNYWDESTPHICVIITDGSDNSSKHFDCNIIKNSIIELEQKNWIFLLLTSDSNFDLDYTSNVFGIQRNRCISFTSNNLDSITKQVSDTINTAHTMNMLNNLSLI